MSTTTDPWKRRSDESSKTYNAFVAYVHMGADRSLAKLAADLRQTYGEKAPRLRALELSSAKHHWVERVAQIEAAEAAKVRKADIERLRLLAIKQQRMATEALDAAEREKRITVAAAIKLLDQGVRHQLLANGSSTERTAVDDDHQVEVRVQYVHVNPDGSERPDPS
jgi:hypothetical protein